MKAIHREILMNNIKLLSIIAIVLLVIMSLAGIFGPIVANCFGILITGLMALAAYSFIYAVAFTKGHDNGFS